MNAIKKIFNILDPTDKNKFVVLFFFIVLATIFETASISMVIPLVGFLIDSQNYINKIVESQFIYFQKIGVLLSKININELMLVFLILLFIIFILKSLVVSFTLWLNASFTASVENNTSERLYNFYLKQNYLIHVNRDSSILLQNLVQEISRFASAACLPLLILITESLIIIFLSLILIFIEPIGSTLIFFFIIIISLIYFLIIKGKMKIWGEERLHFNQKRLQSLTQSVGAVREILLMWRQEYFSSRFVSYTKSATGVGRKQYFFNNLPKIMFELLAVFALMFLIYYLYFIKETPNNIIPTIAFFVAASFKLLPSANRILYSLQSLKFSLANIERIHSDIEKIDNKIPKSKILFNNNDINFLKEIELKKIFFNYNKNGYQKNIFNDLNLKLLKGEIIGLIGQTGSGKTTLVDLLLGLLPLSKGQILIDKKEIQLFENKSWQNIIGYVPQDVHLLNDSLKKNIAFGLEENEIDQHKLNKAIVASQLEKLVNNLGKSGVDTIVGERGGSLSGGQIQRIGIARALYNDPKILILDEATSSLDRLTEKAILNEVYNNENNKTIIIISHNLEVLNRCNKIYKLSDGKLSIVKE